MMLNLEYSENRLERLVENRTVYTLKHSELNIYETYKQAERVALQFNDPVLASMIRGKKVMHLRNNPGFDFFPGESIILPGNETMLIDFPEATEQNPTQCLALRMSNEKINTIVEQMNELQPRVDEGKEWQFTNTNFHFMNDMAVNQIIERMIFLFTENHPAKDLFADFMLKELIIRLMQTEARSLLTNHNAFQHQNSFRFAFIVQYIRDHLHEPLTIEQLSQKACMSQPNFFKCFKNEFGISAVDFINNERIKKAVNLLKETNKPLAAIGIECGFNNISYFNKMFKRLTNKTPMEYRQQSHLEF
jgi:AraC family transcriptional regulator